MSATPVREMVEDVTRLDQAQSAMPLPGGVQKVPHFLNSDEQYFPENTAGSVQKVGDFLNVYDENKSAPTAKTGTQLVCAEDASQALRNSLPVAAPAGKMGRPLTMTPEMLEQICLLLSIGLSRRQAASYLGISPGSISNAVQRNPELAEQLRHAEEMQSVHPELTIVAEARRNWRAAAWYLTYKGKQKRPLSEEEKQEQHQAKLADLKRQGELDVQKQLNANETMAAFRRAQEKPAPTVPAVAETRRKRR